MRVFCSCLAGDLVVSIIMCGVRWDAGMRITGSDWLVVMAMAVVTAVAPLADRYIRHIEGES